MVENQRSVGKKYEKDVVAFLEKKHYNTIVTNYQSGRYEIDIIALDTKPTTSLPNCSEVLVFLEVKYRVVEDEMGSHYNPYASIPPSKQNRIIRAAEKFLSSNEEYRNHFSRFDAVLVLERLSNKETKIVHLENAFIRTA